LVGGDVVDGVGQKHGGTRACTLGFAPGGYHIMCVSPDAVMMVGTKVPIAPKFADGKTATAQFAVQGPGDK
jgi:copper(I)-binding protein